MCDTTDDIIEGFAAGVLIAVVVYFFPFFPFAIAGYEIGKTIWDINLIKWGLALALFVGAFLASLRFSSVGRYRGGKIALLYLGAIPLYYLVHAIFPENKVAFAFIMLIEKLVGWLFST